MFFITHEGKAHRVALVLKPAEMEGKYTCMQQNMEGSSEKGGISLHCAGSSRYACVKRAATHAARAFPTNRKYSLAL